MNSNTSTASASASTNAANAANAANTNHAIDFKTLPANIPSLCIPRVYPNINEIRIRKIFNDLDLGDIERIDIVNKTNEKGEKFNRVFIHFKRWYVNENADAARERLQNGKDIKIIYDDPWFWKISAYREPIQKPNPQQVPTPFIKKKVMLIIESDDEDSASKQQTTDRRDDFGPDFYKRRDDFGPDFYRRDDRRRPDDRGYDRGYDSRRPDDNSRRPDDRGYDRGYDSRRPDDRGYDRGYDSRRPDDDRRKQEKPRQNEGFKKTKKEDTEKVSVQAKRELVKYGYGVAPSIEMNGGICMDITKQQRQPNPKSKSKPKTKTNSKPLEPEVKIEEANK